MLRYVLALFFIPFFFLSCSSQNQSADSSQALVVSADTSSVVLSISQKIVLYANAPLDAASVNGTSVILKENNTSTAIEADITLDATGKKITVTPYMYLAPATTYSVTVTPDIQDTQGRHLSKPYEYTFTTANDAVDTTPLLLRNHLPDVNATVTVENDIVLDFNKNLAMLPAGSNASDYIQVTDSNGSSISGNISVFNSLLIFTPTQPLNPTTSYTVTIQQEVSDLYGINSNVSGLTWQFSTYATNAQNAGVVGFVPKNLQQAIATVDTNETGLVSVKLLQPPKFDTTDNTYYGLVILFYTDKIKVYKISFGTGGYMALSQPTMEHLYDFAFATSAPITAAKVLSPVSVVVGLADGSLLVLGISKTTAVLGQTLNDSVKETIYSLHVNSNDGYVYAVGPKFGLGIYTVDAQSGTLTQHFREQNASKIYLDVVDYLDTQNNQIKVAVADYNGGVDFYDTNGTFLLRTDINASVKRLGLDMDYTGYINGIYALATSGLRKRLLLDGSLDTFVKNEFFPFVRSLFTYADSNLFDSGMVVNSDKDGILIASANDLSKPNSIIVPNYRVVDSELLFNDVVGDNYILVGGDAAQLEIYNMFYGSSMFLYAQFGTTITPDANFTLGIDAHYMDYSAISGYFSVTDVNTSTPISFTFSVGFTSDYLPEIRLIPDANLTSGHDYNVSFATLKNMMGEEIDAANASIIFSVN